MSFVALRKTNTPKIVVKIKISLSLFDLGEFKIVSIRLAVESMNKPENNWQNKIQVFRRPIFAIKKRSITGAHKIRREKGHLVKL